MASVSSLQGPPNGKHDLEKSDKSDKASDRDRPLDDGFHQTVIFGRTHLYP